MSPTWVTVIGLCATTAAIKAAGPVAFGGRDLPPVVLRLIGLLASALLAALVAVETFATPDGELAVDERAAGIGVAGGVLWWRRDAMLPAVLAGAATAALLRALA
jgi:branched-subunit amino acid transport protein